MAAPPFVIFERREAQAQDAGGWPTFFCFLELFIKVAAPPFVIFERWEAQAPPPHRLEFLLHWKLEGRLSGKVTVRVSHPSKTAMGGVASVW